MKKNLRLALLLALVVLMLGVTMLVAAAVDPADTDYFEVTDATGAHVGYYETGADAVAAVAADNYTIKIIKDLNLGADIKLNVNRTYTVDGGNHIVFFKEELLSGRVYGFNITTGNITIKNVTIKNDAGTRSLVYHNSTTDVILENVILDGGTDQITLNKAGNLTIRGENTIIGRNSTSEATGVICLKNASATGKLTIENGSFTATSAIIDAIGATVEISGGRFETNQSIPVIRMGNNKFVSAIKITAGTFEMTAGGNLIEYTGSGDCAGYAANDHAVINISNGTFNHIGAGSFMVISAASVANQQSGGGTMSIDGHPVIKISGGMFNGWPDKPDLTTPDENGRIWTARDHASTEAGLGTIDTDLFLLDGTPAELNITGGTFIGSFYTYSLIRATSADAAAPVSEINISSGTFTGGQAWLRTENATIWNISGDCQFSEPGRTIKKLDKISGKREDYTETRGFWATMESGRYYAVEDLEEDNEDENYVNTIGYIKLGLDGQPVAPSARSRAGAFNISGGTFTTTYQEYVVMFQGSGADINISGGTFNIGFHGINLENGRQVSYVCISGGTFNGSGNGSIINYAATTSKEGQETDEAYLNARRCGQHGGVEITGGTFNTTDKSVAVYFNNQFQPRNIDEVYVRISGGTFTSSGVYLVNVESAQGEVTISGGTFQGSAKRLINLGSYNAQVNITGGTFRLSAVLEGQSVERTDAILRLMSTTPSKLSITGGTFINDREGASQLILINSKPAQMVVVGGEYMSRYEIPNFLDRDLGHGNMPFSTDTTLKKTVDGVEYYCATIHSPSNIFAPVLATDVTIRINRDTPGIRFTSYMSAEKIAALGETNCSYGTLIAPKEYIMQITDFSDVHGQLKAISQTAGVAESKVFADVVADAGIKTDESGNVTFTAALIGITDKNKAYGAVSYVKVTDGDNTVYYYSGINMASNIATLSSVAMRELNDVNDRAAEFNNRQYVYKYGSINNDGFSRYTTEEQQFLRTLAR